MKNIKNKAEVVFTERKTKRNKDRSISRYGIIEQIEDPGNGGGDVQAPKWFEKWCIEEFKPFKNDFYSFKEETKEQFTKVNERIDNLQMEMNNKFDNLVSKNKLKE